MRICWQRRFNDEEEYGEWDIVKEAPIGQHSAKCEQGLRFWTTHNAKWVNWLKSLNLKRLSSEFFRCENGRGQEHYVYDGG